MALATRPKPKAQHRKRVAQHHKHTPHYLKTYWPYLPALAVIVLGAVVNQLLYNSPQLYHAGAALQEVSEPTRIEALTGNTNGLAFAVLISVAAIAFGVFLLRHWFRLQRTISKGEAFVAKHPAVDLLLIVLVTLGVVLSRQVI